MFPYLSLTPFSKSIKGRQYQLCDVGIIPQNTHITPPPPPEYTHPQSSHPITLIPLILIPRVLTHRVIDPRVLIPREPIPRVYFKLLLYLLRNHQHSRPLLLNKHRPEQISPRLFSIILSNVSLYTVRIISVVCQIKIQVKSVVHFATNLQTCTTYIVSKYGHLCQ